MKTNLVGKGNLSETHVIFVYLGAGAAITTPKHIIQIHYASKHSKNTFFDQREN